MAAKISKIVVAIGDTEHSLSLAEARELRDALNSLLGAPATYQPVIERIVERPFIPWRGPYWSVSASKTAADTAQYEAEIRALTASDGPNHYDH